MIPIDVRRRVEAAVGSGLSGCAPATGGSINDAFLVQLDDGRAAFLKTNSRLPAEVFAREAQGLAWLAETRTVSVPEVLACSSPSDVGPGFLLLERIERGRTSHALEERLGRELAALHAVREPRFGLAEPNFLATLEQSNRPETDWATFYRTQRLEPLFARAEARGLVSDALRKDFERLLAELPTLVGPAEPPSRLHGDLWSGNWIPSPDGRPFVVDPAVYAGHREMDLAMMRLFGGFGRRVFEAYDEALPLADKHEERVELHQLYPLLAHVVMFGSSYVGQLHEAVVNARPRRRAPARR